MRSEKQHNESLAGPEATGARERGVAQLRDPPAGADAADRAGGGVSREGRASPRIAADEGLCFWSADCCLSERGRSMRVAKGLSNREVVTLAVYLLGGASRHIDTEDVAVKANEMAPGRFVWKKYPDQINLELIRVYLSDAKTTEKVGHLLGSGTHGWLLTEKGLAFARRRASDLGGLDLSRQPLSRKERQRLEKERARMLSSEAFAKFKAGDLDRVTAQDTWLVRLVKQSWSGYSIRLETTRN